MKRLTEKDYCGYDIKDRQNFNGYDDDKDCQKIFSCLQKLGKHEDIEEELGIDLITLFKALENGFYAKRNLLGNPIQKIETSRYYSVKINSFKMIVYDSYDDDYGGDGWKLEDYGKTWALTKEELEGAQNV